MFRSIRVKLKACTVDEERQQVKSVVNHTNMAISTPLGQREVDLAASLILDTHWTETAYLALTELNRVIELSEGKLVVYEMPTPAHQRIIRRLTRLFEAALAGSSSANVDGEVLFAPVPVRLWPGKYREPDVMVYLVDAAARLHEAYGDPPDLVIEVLSPGTQHIDRGEKSLEYAQAGVREYWLVDPETESVQTFVLTEGHFTLAGHHTAGQEVRSALLPESEISVDDIFAVHTPGA